eukprot:16047867-Heterocapsa_arctica.AAC.1
MAPQAAVEHGVAAAVQRPTQNSARQPHDDEDGQQPSKEDEEGAVDSVQRRLVRGEQLVRAPEAPQDNKQRDHSTEVYRDGPEEDLRPPVVCHGQTPDARVRTRLHGKA